MLKVSMLSTLLTIACVFVSAGVRPVQAQQIDLPIQNLPQETDVWCWAAVAQQIILSLRGPNGTPPQCFMVAIANNAPPAACCNQNGRFNGNPPCRRTGSLQQIQWLIGHFGGSYSTIAPPAHPQVLFSTLSQGRPIILEVRSSPYSSHVVVLRGMTVVNGIPYLHINDPLSFFTQPVPFQSLMNYWASAIVVG